MMKNIGDGWLYARKSAYRGRQKDRGRSVREQLNEEREWCGDNDVLVAGEYVDDDRSASPLTEGIREEFERMIEDINAGRIPRGDVVVVWEASRLYRDLEVYVRLRNACWKAGVYWCINGDPFDLSKRSDRKRSAYDAIDAEDQVYEISERVQRSLRDNARRGRPHGVPLFGYIRRYDPRSGGLVAVEIDEEQAAIVRELFERVAVHDSMSSIMRDFNRRGVPSPSQSCHDIGMGMGLGLLREAAGMSVDDAAAAMDWRTGRLERVEAARWSIRLDDLERLCRLYGADEEAAVSLVAVWRRTPQWTMLRQLRSILTNPAYIGRRYHNGKDAGEAIWPPIVDKVTFHAVQLILSDPKRRTGRTSALTHLLTGLADCAMGGCHGVARSATASHSGKYFVYRCEPNRHFQVPAETLERYVVAQLVLRFSRRDAANLFAVHGTGEDEVRRLQGEVAELEASLAEAEQMVAQRQMTSTRLANLEALINPQIEAAGRKIGRARVDPLLSSLIKPDAAAVYAEWKRWTLAQKRAVIRSELQIVISPIGKGRRNVPVEEYVHLAWRRDQSKGP